VRNHSICSGLVLAFAPVFSSNFEAISIDSVCTEFIVRDDRPRNASVLDRVVSVSSICVRIYAYYPYWMRNQVWPLYQVSCSRVLGSARWFCIGEHVAEVHSNDVLGFQNCDNPWPDI
jgi:hypothetical protein